MWGRRAVWEDLVCVSRSGDGRSGSQGQAIGGINRSRGAMILPLDTPDNPLRNTQDVSVLLGESINQVRRGQLDSRIANAVGYLASILLGALQQGQMRTRVMNQLHVVALKEG